MPSLDYHTPTRDPQFDRIKLLLQSRDGLFRLGRVQLQHRLIAGAARVPGAALAAQLEGERRLAALVPHRHLQRRRLQAVLRRRAGRVDELLRLRSLFTPETVRALDMGSTALAEVGSKLIYANGATYSRIECNNAAAALRALASAVREHSRAHVARRGK